MFENLVVGASEAEGALDALALAKTLAPSAAELTVLHVAVEDPRHSGNGPDLGPDAPLPKPVLTLPDGTNGAGHPLAVVTASSAAAGLGAYALRAGADLLVVGASRRDGLRRVLGRGTTDAVLDDPPCAVAVAPAGYAGRASALSTIGVGYDGSLASESALAVARTLAEERNAKLSAFEAVPPLVFSSQPWRAEYEVERRVTSAQERVDRLRGVEGHAGFGPADSELANFGQGLGLLVLGPHEHDDVPSGGRTLAQRLAGGAPCPLLVLALPRHPE